MSGETAGRLYVERDLGMPILRTDKRIVSKPYYSGGSEDPDVDGNARRLAACWNACEQVPTEVLEATLDGRMAVAVFARGGNPVAERDEAQAHADALAAALEWTIRALDSYDERDGPQRRSPDEVIARAALAAYRGEGE